MGVAYSGRGGIVEDRTPGKTVLSRAYMGEGLGEDVKELLRRYEEYRNMVLKRGGVPVSYAAYLQGNGYGPTSHIGI